MTHLEAFLQKLPAGTAALISAPQNQYYLSGFHFEDGYLLIFADEALLLTDPRYEEAAKKDSFTAEEIYRMNKYLPDDRVGWSIRLMLGTGMRTQELLALQPKHIAFDGSKIDVHQAVVMQKGTAVIGPTKTRESYRTIPVPMNLRQCAIKLRNTDKEYCWYGTKTAFINPSTFRYMFKEALAEVGEVRILTPHCCRHTYVSQLQSQGVDIETIMAMTGHTKLQTTEHYLHVQPKNKDDAIAQLNVLFAS